VGFGFLEGNGRPGAAFLIGALAATAFFAGTFFTGAFFTGAFFATAFLAAAFFTGAFFAGDFFAAALLADVFLTTFFTDTPRTLFSFPRTTKCATRAVWSHCLLTVWQRALMKGL
jgi:uncharacterized protein YjbI with pentapeptide repeats